MVKNKVDRKKNKGNTLIRKLRKKLRMQKMETDQKIKELVAVNKVVIKAMKSIYGVFKGIGIMFTRKSERISSRLEKIAPRKPRKYRKKKVEEQAPAQ